MSTFRILELSGDSLDLNMMENAIGFLMDRTGKPTGNMNTSCCLLLIMELSSQWAACWTKKMVHREYIDACYIGVGWRLVFREYLDSLKTTTEPSGTQQRIVTCKLYNNDKIPPFLLFLILQLPGKTSHYTSHFENCIFRNSLTFRRFRLLSGWCRADEWLCVA